MAHILPNLTILYVYLGLYWLVNNFFSISGLQYIVEVQPDAPAATVDSAEKSPTATESSAIDKCYYICVQCSKKFTGLPVLLQHIKSLRHKLAFAVSVDHFTTPCRVYSLTGLLRLCCRWFGYVAAAVLLYSYI